MPEYYAQYAVKWHVSYSEPDHFSGCGDINHGYDQSEDARKMFRERNSQEAFQAAERHVGKLCEEKKKQLMEGKGSALYKTHITLEVKLSRLEMIQTVKLPDDLPICKTEF